MSALALVLHGRGERVTGSDVANAYGRTGQLLDAAGIVSGPFRSEAINNNIDYVVVGASFGSDNVEVSRAQTLGIKVYTLSEVLHHITANKRLVAVAGTHGKTTTTSLLTYLLRAGELDPSWLIGTTEISGLPAHGGAGQGDLFVVEADEYKKAADDPTPKFLDYAPFGLVLTNIEHDHPDIYPTMADFRQAFERLVALVRPDGLIVANGDDPTVLAVLRDYHRHVRLFGFDASNDFRLTMETDLPGFSLATADHFFGPFALQLPGRHNHYNAAAAAAMALSLGLREATIKEALPQFSTVERRFQILGTTSQNVLVIDDYAHHPTAISATLQTAKALYPNRPLWVAFQSHTYSRTKALLADFARAFGAADHVIVTDIFASAREREVLITGEELAAAIGQNQSSVEFVVYEDLPIFLAKNTPPGAVLIVMGASKINEIGQMLVRDSA